MNKLIEWGFSQEQAEELMKRKEVTTLFGKCRYNKNKEILTITYSDGRVKEIQL